MKRSAMPKKNPITLQIDVSSSVSLTGPLKMATSVFLPEPEKLVTPPVVIFAVPGGGYSRGYFDMHFPGHRGYSQAEYHVQQGFIFVACDHIGVGESTIPDLGKITFEILAATYNAAVRDIVERLEKGTLSEGFPPMPEPVKIGIGQSMGGCITILTQALHGPFDALAPLGYSAIHSVLAQPTPEELQSFIGQYENVRRGMDFQKFSIPKTSGPRTQYRYGLHWEDVPEDIVDADLKGGYPIRRTVPSWGSATMPYCVITMVSPGCITKEAAAIRVPVLIGVGERDTCLDPHAEPSRYKQSMDVSLYIVPKMAHMHNFASTRRLLWDRIAHWSRMIAWEINRGR